MQLRSFDAVCRTLEAGVGVGILPVTTARRAAQTMDLAVTPLLDTWTLRELRICVRDLATLSARVRELVESLAAQDGT